MVISLAPPTSLNQVDNTITCRKTDPELNKICVSTQNDFFLSGTDKNFKKYKYPDEKLEKMDLKVKLPALSPIEELEGHALPITAVSCHDDIIVTGSQDGEVILRHVDKF